MDVIPLGPGFAAELRGVTLADVASDDAAYAAARAAFEEHSVLVLRNQEVTDEIQLAFSRRFGPAEVTKVGSQGTGTHFVILSTIGPDGKVVPPDHRIALRNKANQLWHTDSSFRRVPALTSILSARIIPARGGETEFVSTRLAFERLDPSLREKLENSFAWHDYAHSRSQITADLASPEERAALPPQCWRMVWKNPAHGRGAIYLASHAYAVESMEPAAGKKLIDELMAAASARRRTGRTTLDHDFLGRRPALRLRSINPLDARYIDSLGRRYVDLLDRRCIDPLDRRIDIFLQRQRRLNGAWAGRPQRNIGRLQDRRNERGVGAERAVEDALAHLARGRCQIAVAIACKELIEGGRRIDGNGGIP